MTETPRTEFKFTNDNLNEVVPALGVSNVVARTTRGPFCEPSTLIRSITQFRRLFGTEIVPDGTVSNIERALSTGSILRISRVKGGTPPEFGFAKTYNMEDGVGEEDPADIHIKLTNPMVSTETIDLSFKVVTREAGSSILDPNTNNANLDFYLKLYVDNSTPINRYYIQQFKNFNASDSIDPTAILSTDSFLQATGVMGGTTPVMVNPETFQSFITSAPNIIFQLITCTTAIGDLATTVKTTDDALNVIRAYKDWFGQVYTATTLLTSAAPVYYIINEGTNGGVSTKDTWVEAYEASLDYNDGYQTILSHVHQHLPNNYIEIYKAVMDISSRTFEEMVYIEVPKYDTEGVIRTPESIITQVNTMISTIGYHKNAAYFCGGIQLYDSNGVLKKCDVLGTILGLGDSAASNFGPYFSFAGMNRGIVNDGVGPVMINLGSPSKINVLDSLANAKLNLFVIKDTPANGKRTMLWHNFSSTFTDSSDKFISAVRLQLYLKKRLRPLIEKRYEEPNSFPTWKALYYEAKPILDDLLGVSFTEYVYMGDQFATKYVDMVINEESEVRSGKYKIKIAYRDIVTLQWVEVEFVVEATNRSITVNINE